MSAVGGLQQLGFFDLETTGLDVWSVRVVTAAVGLLGRDGRVERISTWLVNPGVPIPESASSVHGITDEIAIRNGTEASRAISEIVSELNGIFETGTPVVAFNAAYDFSIISAEAARYGVPEVGCSPVYDPLVIERKFDNLRAAKRTLGHLTVRHGIELNDAHTAEADAIAAAQLAWKQIERYPAVAQSTVASLHQNQTIWAEEQAADLEAYMQQRSPEFRVERGWPLRRRAS